MPTGAPKADADMLAVLKERFGFPGFLPNQASIVRAILDRRDTFVVMPTGGGKSLCYQLPAAVLDGVCLVISPLISLMKDQVDAALANGLRAAFLNSSLPPAQKRRVEAQLAAGGLDLLYVSPERFAMDGFLGMLKRVRPVFVAIDEAHCISEWGHDFRPDYLNLSRIVEVFPEVPVAAFTATATQRVQADIVDRLGLRAPFKVRASFNRPNLFYQVLPKASPGAQILRFVQRHGGESGIVYRMTRKDVEKTAALLSRHGVRALPYHAGMSDAERSRNQEAFNRDQIDVIVATIAFGMGIDKSNVRYVVHGDLPKNIESYYQETGRAGRDGEPAQCLLLFGYGDLPRIRYFIDSMPDSTERDRALGMLNDMVNLASRFACRRKQLLGYFGEDWPPPAAAPLQHAGRAATCCDICAGRVESVEITRDAQMVMSAMARTGNRYGINHIVAVVTGDPSDRVMQLGHDRLKTFGVGKDRDKRYWRLVIDNLLGQDLVRQTEGTYPVLQLAPTAREVLFGDRKVRMLKTPRRASGRSPRIEPVVASADAGLFDRLRALRRSLAALHNVPPYVVFTDRTLHAMAREQPQTESDLRRISGVGATRLARYGRPFLDLLRDAT